MIGLWFYNPSTSKNCRFYIHLWRAKCQNPAYSQLGLCKQIRAKYNKCCKTHGFRIGGSSQVDLHVTYRDSEISWISIRCLYLRSLSKTVSFLSRATTWRKLEEKQDYNTNAYKCAQMQHQHNNMVPRVHLPETLGLQPKNNSSP